MTNSLTAAADGIKIEKNDFPFLKQLYEELQKTVPNLDRIDFVETGKKSLSGLTVYCAQQVQVPTATRWMRDISSKCNCESQRVNNTTQLYKVKAPNSDTRYSIEFRGDTKTEHSMGMDLLMASMGEAYTFPPGHRNGTSFRD